MSRDRLVNKLLKLPEVREYFRESLTLEDDDFDRRLQMYLELFPFIAADFRLRSDCHELHRNLSSGSKEKTVTFSQIKEEYRAALEELRESLTDVEVEII